MVEKIQHQNETMAPCLLCGPSSSAVIYRKDKWQYLQCKNCGLVSIYPRPSTFGVLNNYETYLPTNILDIKKWEQMMRPVIETSVKLIRSRAQTDPGKLLDIGCGFGFFLNAMKQHLWEVTGIEISEDGRNYVKNHYGINVY